MAGRFKFIPRTHIRTTIRADFWQRTVAVSTVLSMICLLFTGTTGIAFAQETINNASASGQVLDPSGSAVPGAAVVALQIETNQANKTITDQDGRYRFSYLKPGGYEVSVQAAGFSDSKRTVTLTIGSAFELKTVLSLTSANTEVSVTADTEVLETARTQISGTLPQGEIEDLPLS